MIVKAWGNWELFQSLLQILRDIGNKHGGISIANVATRWVLEHDFVGAVIIGMCICTFYIIVHGVHVSLIFVVLRHSHGNRGTYRRQSTGLQL